MKKGFTLIELLIVIAIIAILALIAVPNFLEAQTRAKISRVYADMRTIATAVETYTVDWGRGPISWWEYDNIYTDVVPTPGGRGVYRQLTTPVAYITTVPTDSFTSLGYTSPSKTSRNAHDPYDYRWIQPLSTDGPTSSRRQLQAVGVSWYIYSWGPARTSADANNTWKGPQETLLGKNDFLYDATNGTLSRGLIIRSNKGQMDRVPEKFN